MTLHHLNVLDELDTDLWTVNRHLDEIAYEMEDDSPENLAKRRKVVKRKGHLDEADVEHLNQERGYRVETLVNESKPDNQKAKKKFSCMECSYESPYISSMLDHVNSQHKKIPLECTECEYVCLNFKAIHLHRRQKHKMKSMKCPSCSFKGVVLWQMENHMRDKHDRLEVPDQFETEYATPDGKAPTAEQLAPKARGAQRGHRHNGGEITKSYNIGHDPLTGKRIYLCTLCDQKNARQFNMLIHLNMVHFKRQLQCTWCDFTTLNENTLCDHSKKEHGQSKKECIIPDCKYATNEENRYHQHLLKKHNAVYDPTDHSIKVVT